MNSIVSISSTQIHVVNNRENRLLTSAGLVQMIEVVTNIQSVNGSVLSGGKPITMRFSTSNVLSIKFYLEI